MRLFLNNAVRTVTIPKELLKAHVKKASIFAVNKKVMEVTSF
jgi:hypothetical protein